MSLFQMSKINFAEERGRASLVNYFYSGWEPEKEVSTYLGNGNDNYKRNLKPIGSTELWFTYY